MRWSYKTVHYELKKEGLLGSAFLDAPEIELSLNEYGRAGWELVSTLETMDGIIAVFKQSLSGDSSPLFQIDPVENDHNKTLPVERSEITEREPDPVPFETFAQDEVDDFEVVEMPPRGKEPVEKEPPESEGDVGAIRIE
ncbi:MAG: DUF4177 domain-containing protein [Desulfobulbaceae bacterium]|nr:DUF4177 domain-containing protein [Desulfobulbaceae bacterium]